MRTIFYLDGKPEPLAEADVDALGVDEVLTIEGFAELRTSLNACGETGGAFLVVRRDTTKNRGSEPLQEVTIREFKASGIGIIDFAVLGKLIDSLPPECRSQTKTAMLIPWEIVSSLRRSVRRIRRRPLYGLRMTLRDQGLTRLQAGRLAAINHQGRAEPFTYENADRPAGIDAIENTDADDLFPGRRRKDRWLGDPDLFACCSGRGFHVTRAGQIYCPCAAGFLRADLDRNTL